MRNVSFKCVAVQKCNAKPSKRPDCLPHGDTHLNAAAKFAPLFACLNNWPHHQNQTRRIIRVQRQEYDLALLAGQTVADALALMFVSGSPIIFSAISLIGRSIIKRKHWPQWSLGVHCACVCLGNQTDQINISPALQNPVGAGGN